MSVSILTPSSPFNFDSISMECIYPVSGQSGVFFSNIKVDMIQIYTHEKATHSKHVSKQHIHAKPTLVPTLSPLEPALTLNPILLARAAANPAAN